MFSCICGLILQTPIQFFGDCVKVDQQIYFVGYWLRVGRFNADSINKIVGNIKRPLRSVERSLCRQGQKTHRVGQRLGNRILIGIISFNHSTFDRRFNFYQATQQNKYWIRIYGATYTAFSSFVILCLLVCYFILRNVVGQIFGQNLNDEFKILQNTFTISTLAYLFFTIYMFVYEYDTLIICKSYIRWCVANTLDCLFLLSILTPIVYLYKIQIDQET